MSIQSDVKTLRDFIRGMGEVIRSEEGLLPQDEHQIAKAHFALLALEARLLYPGITAESEREEARAEAYARNLAIGVAPPDGMAPEREPQ